MAHSYVLVIRSPILKVWILGKLQVDYITRKDKQYKKIVIEDIEPASFKAFLKFLYTDNLDPTPEDIMGVLHSGKFKCFYTLIFS